MRMEWTYTNVFRVKNYLGMSEKADKMEKAEKQKIDFDSSESIESALLRGFEEINEMREKHRKAEWEERVQEIDNEFWFHKQFLEFKVWMKHGESGVGCHFKEYHHLLCLPQTFSLPMDKHHVNKKDVVFIPTLIHRAVKHKQGDGKLEGVVG